MNAIAAVIPAFEAEASVGDIVRRTLEHVPDLVVVDDGSKDATAAVARAAGAEVVVLPRNRGKGAALREAFQLLFERGFERVLTLDADGQHLPEEIPKLRAREADADLVLGDRRLLFTEMSGLRRVSNRLSSIGISLLAGRSLGDVQSGFRIYTKRLIDATGFPEWRFDAESAVVVRAARQGFRIVAVPVRLGFADGRTTSHYRPLVDSLRIARAVFRARLEDRQ
jgi:glycosyltransferase involved in cell wall biosynthesis